MPLNFQNNGSNKTARVLLITFIAVSIVLMTVYSMGGQTGPLHTMQRSANALIAPFQLVGSASGAFVENASEMVGDATASQDTLSALQEQNAQLTELLTQSEEYRLEAQRLQDLLKLKQTYDIEGVSGRVIGHSYDAWNQTVTIDVGEDDGVSTGLTVMGSHGVIGQVMSVTSSSSVVRLLTDPQSGVSAMIQSSRAQGIVRGSLNGLLHFENVEEDAKVKEGDVVLTSGLGGSFVKGLLIGQVIQVSGNAADGTRQILVSSNMSSSALEEVMVVFSAAGGN